MITSACLLGSDESFIATLIKASKDEQFEIYGVFDRCSDIRPDRLDSECVAIVDLPNTQDQLEGVKACKARYPSSPVVILSREFDLDAMTRCFDQGAIGYLLRSLEPRTIIATIRLMAHGDKAGPSNLTDESDFTGLTRSG